MAEWTGVRCGPHEGDILRRFIRGSSARVVVASSLLARSLSAPLPFFDRLLLLELLLVLVVVTVVAARSAGAWPGGFTAAPPSRPVPIDKWHEENKQRKAGCHCSFCRYLFECAVFPAYKKPVETNN